MKIVKNFLIILFAVFAWLGAQAQAETVFYSNTYPAVFTLSPVYYTTGSSEWADDIPFSGSHSISSFSFGYKSSESVRAVFRFYGVDAGTGKPGLLMNEFSRILPAGQQTQIIQLDAAEQFVFTAEPGINKTTKSGGWFSIQFESVLGGALPTTLQLRLATGSSSNSFYNVTTGTTVATLDPDGLLPASFYLEMRSSQSAGVELPVPTDLQLLPSTVIAGNSVIGTVVLDTQAPIGGVIVSLSSSNQSVATLPDSEILIPSGQDRAQFTVYTAAKVSRRGKVVEISATANDVTVSKQLYIIR